MERFILKFNNGTIRSQKGLNMTYDDMLCLGVLSWWIDTKEGTMTFYKNDERHEVKVPSFDSSDLVNPKD